MSLDVSDTKRENSEVGLVRDKRMWLSMGASIISFVISIGVSFFLTPFLIKNLGEAEYSFYPLASSFVSCITIVTIALNSMASRFVTVSWHRQQKQEAKEYFSSTFFANVILSGVLLPFVAVFILNIRSFLNVPDGAVTNVQLLFSLVFLCLFIGQIGTVYNIATFCCDRLYLQNLTTIASYIIMAAVAVVLFSCFPANLYYVGIMNLCSSVVVFGLNFLYTRLLMPEMKVSKKYFNRKRVFQLVSSGIWNSVSQLSNVLLNGLDLLISNLYLGPEAAAVVSVSKILPNQLTAMVSTVGNVFSPRFARQFAHEDKRALVESIKSSIKLMGSIFCLPIGFLIAFGNTFFHLWVPSMDANLLQILSILGMGVLFISASLNPVYGVFTVTNKVRANAIVVLITGVINVAAVIITLQFVTDQTVKMIVIVGVSTLIGIVRNLTFTIIYSAKVIKMKWNSFYGVLFVNMGLLMITTVVYFGVKVLVPSNNWFMLILCGAIGTLLNLVMLYFVVLKKSERKALILFIKSKVSRK